MLKTKLLLNTVSVVAVLVLVVVIICALYWEQVHLSQQNHPVAQSVASTTPTLPPPPNSSEIEQLQTMPVFQYVVDYTDTGFQPANLSIKKGETVRFFNESSLPLQVDSYAIGTAALYPDDQHSSCRGSTFDSCNVLPPQHFWEFTFTHEGVWSYHNDVATQHIGVIQVAH